MAKNGHFSMKSKGYSLTKMAQNGHFSTKTKGYISLPKWLKMVVFRLKVKAIGLQK